MWPYVVAKIMNYHLSGSLLWSFDAASSVPAWWNTEWFRWERSVFWEVLVSVVKEDHVSMCQMHHGYWDKAVWICLISVHNSVRFLFVGLDGEQSLQKEGSYLRRIACLHFGCHCSHKESWRSVQTNKMWSSHTSCQSALRMMVGFLNIYCEL